MNKKRLFTGLLLALFVGLFALSCDDGGGGGGGGGSAPVDYERASEVLGRGYDITTKYADSQYIKGEILDFDKLQADNMIRRGTINAAEFKTIFGTTVEEYQESLMLSFSHTASISVPRASFANEVRATFSDSRATSSSYAFATETSRIQTESYVINDRLNYDRLSGYVSSDFIALVNSTDNFTRVIERYGTHVMLGGVWGARLDYNLSTQKRSESAASAIGTYVQSRASVKIKVVNVGTETEAEVDRQYESAFDTSKTVVNTVAYGGDPTKARSVHSKQDYDAWLATIAGNEIWSEYYVDGLIPIYHFVSDEDKRDNLTKAYVSYLKSKAIVVQPPVSATLSGTKTQTLDEFGGAKVINGDGEVGSKNGKITRWQLVLKLSPTLDKKNAVLDYTYDVYETGDTTLQKKGNITVPLNKTNVVIPEDNDCFIQGRVDSERHDLVSVNEEVQAYGCNILTSLKVKVDHSGRDDQDKIGFMGELKFDYVYANPEAGI